MSKVLASGAMSEFTEYKDVILRIFTERGSSPIVIVADGKKRTAEEIGNQILSTFTYLVESEVFDNGR